MKINYKLHSPDSSKVIVSHYQDYGALGNSGRHISILKNGEKTPKTGNLIDDGYTPRMEWVSNDLIRVHCNSESIDQVKSWAVANFRGVNFLFVNNSKPFELHKKYYFSDFEIIEDSSITFKCGIENFLYYLESDEDYTFPIKNLVIKYKDELIEKMEIKDNLVFFKKDKVIDENFVITKYYPKFELIPSYLSIKELERLEKLIAE